LPGSQNPSPSLSFKGEGPIATTYFTVVSAGCVAMLAAGAGPATLSA
jgi:hypothetical protein